MMSWFLKVDPNLTVSFLTAKAKGEPLGHVVYIV